jgi:ATP-dependent Clp protease ATP-binding subunit ClpX
MVKLGFVNVAGEENLWDLQGYGNKLLYFNPALQDALAGSVKGIERNGSFSTLSNLIQEHVVKVNSDGIGAYIRTQPIFEQDEFLSSTRWWKTLKNRFNRLSLEDAIENEEKVFEDVGVVVKPFKQDGKVGYDILVNIDKGSGECITSPELRDLGRRESAYLIDHMKPATANAPIHGSALDKREYRLSKLVEFTKDLEKVYAAIAKKAGARFSDDTLLLAPQFVESAFLNDASYNIYQGRSIVLTDSEQIGERPVVEIELQRQGKAAGISRRPRKKPVPKIGNGSKKKPYTNNGDLKDKSLDFKNYQTVKKILDKYIIGQSDATLTLSEAICDHYQRMQMSASDKKCVKKDNILMIGPTGCGKTYLARTVAGKVLNVPFAEFSLPQVTAAGYVGGDVNTILEELIGNAGGDVSAAEHGIVFLDEIDKIRRDPSRGRDIKGDDVQNELLTMLAGEVKQTKYGAIDTSNILFICGGAFEGIEPYLNGRKKVTADALRAYGLKGELVGRLPYVVELNKLNKSDYVRILKNARESPLRGKETLFKQYGIDLVFSDSAINRIAALAEKDTTGARALDGLLATTLKGLRNPKHKYVSKGKLRINKARVDEQMAKYR